MVGYSKHFCNDNFCMIFLSWYIILFVHFKPFQFQIQFICLSVYLLDPRLRAKPYLVCLTDLIWLSSLWVSYVMWLYWVLKNSVGYSYVSRNVDSNHSWFLFSMSLENSRTVFCCILIYFILNCNFTPEVWFCYRTVSRLQLRENSDCMICYQFLCREFSSMPSCYRYFLPTHLTNIIIIIIIVFR